MVKAGPLLRTRLYLSKVDQDKLDALERMIEGASPKVLLWTGDYYLVERAYQIHGENIIPKAIDIYAQTKTPALLNLIRQHGTLDNIPKLRNIYAQTKTPSLCNLLEQYGIVDNKDVLELAKVLASPKATKKNEGAMLLHKNGLLKKESYPTHYWRSIEQKVLEATEMIFSRICYGVPDYLDTLIIKYRDYAFVPALEDIVSALLAADDRTAIERLTRKNLAFGGSVGQVLIKRASDGNSSEQIRIRSIQYIAGIVLARYFNGVKSEIPSFVGIGPRRYVHLSEEEWNTFPTLEYLWSASKFWKENRECKPIRKAAQKALRYIKKNLLSSYPAVPFGHNIPPFQTYLYIVARNRNYQSFIKRGQSITQNLLISSLFAFGSEEVAVDFLNCRNPLLGKAAREWAKQHGCQIVTTPGYPAVLWGSKLQK